MPGVQHQSVRGSGWRGQVVAVAASLAALAVRFGLDPILGDYLPYPTFFLAVIGVVWYCRTLAPALTAVGLGYLASTWFFVPPRHGLFLIDVKHQVGAVTYFVVTLALVGFGYALQRSRLRGDALAAERAETEKALRESRDQIRLISDEVPALISYVDTELRYRFCNGTYTEWFKLPPESVLGRKMEEVVGEKAWKTIGPRVTKALTGEVVEYEASTDYASGTRWIHAVYTPHRDVAGRVIGIVVMVHDITERKQSERVLRESDAKYRAIFDGAAVSLWEEDFSGIKAAIDALKAQGVTDFRRYFREHPEFVQQAMSLIRVVDVNDTTVKMFEAGDKAELLGSLPKIFTPESLPIFVEELVAVAEGRTVIELEALLNTARGNPIYALFTMTLPAGTNLNRVLFSLLDITGRKQAEAHLREAHAQLNDRARHLESLVQQRTAKLQEVIGDLEAFSYSVAHDLRAPLRAMAGYAKALKEESGLSVMGRTYLQRLEDAALRLDRLTQEVLSYSQLSRGEIKLERIDLDKLAHGLIEHYPQLANHREHIHITSPLLPVTGHEPLLTQALSNLLVNACKFVAPGTTPNVIVRTEAVAERVRIWVEDNGIGIEPRHHEQVFKLFDRVHPEHKYEGTGVGLAIVRKAAERMGGSVGLASELGKGSKFWIDLARG